jgi:hypothetical protein
LKDWYDKLSETVLSATENPELFDTARQAIEHHLDIRRVHNLDQKDSAREEKENQKLKGAAASSVVPSEGPSEKSVATETVRETAEEIDENKTDLTKVRPGPKIVCRNCGHRIPPAEVRHIGFESVVCP